MSALQTAIEMAPPLFGLEWFLNVVLFAAVVVLWLGLFVAAAFAVAGLSALLQWLYERSRS